MRCFGCAVALAGAVALGACGGRPGGDGGTDSSLDGVGDAADGGADAADGAPVCPVMGSISAQMLPSVGNVRLAALGDLDGDGRSELVVVPPVAGVVVFQANACGVFSRRASALDGVTVTGITLGRIDTTRPAGANDIVVFTEQRELVALSGAGLRELFRSTLSGLVNAGEVVAAHLAADTTRHHVAAFDQNHGQLLRVENTGTGWMVRASVTLPPGIERVVAGDLGQNGRDELLFLGGGLAEVVSVADFDFSDVRFLSMSPTVAAAFGDFNGDRRPDAAIASGAAIRLWAGDGATRITAGRPYTLMNDVLDIASLDRDGDGRPEVASLDSAGLVDIASLDATGGQSLATDTTTTGANRIFTGRIDEDMRGDVLVTTSDDRVFLWRAP